MKKIKVFALLVCCMAALSSCISHKNEYVPEFDDKNAPKFGTIEMTPKGEITSNDAVSVKVDIVCMYGLSGAQLWYKLNDDPKLIPTRMMPFKGENDKSVTYKGDKIIPKQKAGTTVRFQIVASSTRGMRDTTNMVTYTVVDPKPDTEK